MSERKIQWQEISKHILYDDIWFVIEDKVYDPTSFLDFHPGGPALITLRAGQDATKDFIQHGHSKSARNKLDQFQIGLLDKESKQALWQKGTRKVDDLTIISILAIVAIFIYSVYVLYHGPIVKTQRGF